jgi:phage recombination protein Bet
MNAVVKIDGKPSLIATMAARYGVDQDKMMTTLKATAFKGDVTAEQMMALCIVANQYDLNPWTKEIYAFPDKKNGIVPVVGVDGWSRLMNRHADFDGIEYVESEEMVTGDEHKPCPKWIECKIYRKGRSHPVSAKERFEECYRPPFVLRDGNKVNGPWQSHTSRMLRWKSTIQAARIAFGFGGIYDQDEAERIIDVSPPLQGNPRDGLEPQDPATVDVFVAKVADILAMDVEEDVHADKLFEVHMSLCADDALYTAVQDALKARGIIKAAAWKAFIAQGSKRFQETNVGAIR